MNWKNLPAYFAERFPAINMALFAILFVTVYSAASHFAGFSEAQGFGWKEAGGILATISFFFRLRVFDEIKDYDLDAVNHPQRVLQSGRIRMNQLISLSVVGTLLEVGWSLWVGLPTLLCWLAAAGYSLLMRYEFFVGTFLKKRLVLYAFTHMLVMPLIILWVWSAYAPAYEISTAYFILGGLSLLAGFSFELARKIHTRSEERELVDSYSKSLGFQASIVAVLLVLLGGVFTQTYLLSLLQAAPWTYLLIGVLYLATLCLYLYAIVRPGEKLLRTGEKLVSLFMLTSYLLVIIELHF